MHFSYGDIVRPVLMVLLSAFLLAPSALADDSASRPVNRQAWQLCQAGHLEQCERILRSQIDDETRMLVEADRQFARDKVSAHVRLLLSACDARSSVRACDRALSYNLSASERQEVLTVRRSVIQRGVIRVNR
jgi:hypothetical protein